MCDHRLVILKGCSTSLILFGSHKFYEGRDFGLAYYCIPTCSSSWHIIFVEGLTFNFFFFFAQLTPPHPSESMEHQHCPFPILWDSVILSSMLIQLSVHTMVRAFAGRAVIYLLSCLLPYLLRLRKGRDHFLPISASLASCSRLAYSRHFADIE